MTDSLISYRADGTPARDSNLPEYANSRATSTAPEYKPGDDPVRGGEEEAYGPEPKRIRITPTKTRTPAPTTPDNCERGPVPRVVDLEDIERHKENIVPLKSGRSAAALVDLFSTPEKKRAAVLEEQRARFEEEISNADELDDPLEVYQRYVDWTLQSYPEGNSYASKLLVLLERCTRKFRKCDRYTNDPRYVRLWLMYAELVSDPLVVYKYLEANNIGQKQAAFYEEYAEYLEKKKMWHEAELYYKLGINRSAQPLTRIKEKFSLFRARMFLAGVTPSESDLVVDISDAMKKKDVNKPLLVEQQPIVRQFGRGVLSEQIAPLNYQPASSVHHEPANIANESGKRRLQVYVDQENIPPPDTTTAAAAVDGENQAPWDDLGTEAGRIKENEAAFDSWRKPLKMGPVPPKKFTKFKVYEDEQDTLDEAPKTPSHDIPTRSQKEDSPSQSTLLKRDPLHYIHSEDAADKEAKAAVKPPTERKAEVASKREIIVANMELLNHNGEERSFEEVRAAFLSLSKKPALPQLREEEKEIEEEEEELKRPSPVKKQSSNRYMPPSPTINTKNALAEVLEMFNQPLRHERDRAEPVHSKEDTKVAEWAAELVKQPKCTKLQVYCDETDEAEPTPSNPFNAEEEKREEAASTNTPSHIVQSEPASPPIHCNNADAAESAVTQPAPLDPSLYEEEQANNKEITNCHPPPSNVQHDSADGHQSPLALLSPNGQQQKEEILESWTTSQQPHPDPLLNYLDASGHLSDEFDEEIEEDDITLRLNLMREQASSDKTLELHQDDDFTINFSHHNAICSTPYPPHVTSASTQTNQATSNSYSTPKPQHEHRIPVAQLPVLTPITETSERSIHHTNSYYRSELMPTAQLASLREQPEDSSALDDTLDDELLTPPFLLSQNDTKESNE